MFVVELTANPLGDSISLVADSLDMLGDAMVYGFNLYVVARSSTTLLQKLILSHTVFWIRANGQLPALSPGVEQC